MGIYFKIANMHDEHGPNYVAYYPREGGPGTTTELHFSEAAHPRAEAVSTGEVVVLYQRVHGQSRIVTHVFERSAGMLMDNGGHFRWAMPVRVLARLKPRDFAGPSPQYGPIDLVRSTGKPWHRVPRMNTLLWNPLTGASCHKETLAQSGEPFPVFAGYTVKARWLVDYLKRPYKPGGATYPYEWSTDFEQIVIENSQIGVNHL